MLKIIPKEDGDTVILTIPDINLGKPDCIVFSRENIELIQSIYDYNDILVMLAEFNSN